MKKNSSETYVVSIKVKSKFGSKPEIGVVYGDTVFCWLMEGQTARVTMKKLPKIKKVKA